MKAIFGAVLLLASTIGAFAANEPRVLDRSCGKVLCTAMLAVDRKIVGDGTKTIVEFVSAPEQTLDGILGVREGTRHTFTAFCAAGTIRDEDDKSENSLVQIREAPPGSNTKAVAPEKAQLHTRLLKAAMDYACAPGAEVEKVAQVPYYGTWAPTEAACKDEDGQWHTRIDEKGYAEYESFCEVRKVVQSQASQWWLAMDCEGEGETWKSNVRLTLLDKGKLLIEQGSKPKLMRSVAMLCPGKPNGQ